MKFCCLGLVGFWCGLLAAIAEHAADEPAIPAPLTALSSGSALEIVNNRRATGSAQVIHVARCKPPTAAGE